ncbi:MAG TPA: hypothetical protein VMB91_10575 [Solirubrobacteraceae bacterium]|nr:hypothetical protein [Solirubrobacteraceae bacterium]
MNASEMQYARPPAPPSERGAWLLAGGLVLVGVLALTLALSGLLEGSHEAPPPIVLRVATPAPAAAGGAATSASATSATGPAAGTREAIVQQPSASEQAQDPRRFAALTRVHISRHWMEGFYPIYATAQSAFAVNWLLLASIHKQESAFSTAPGIYHGLNFAHCCAGPMQFNVTNGPVSTWEQMRDSYLYGRRPASYDHPTAKHPSVYDDFDSIMAAAHLLSTDGAGIGLEGAAWDAAYDYYGHDATGVLYADQVLARAIGWSQHGFCINCGLEENLVQAVHAAYGAPVLAALIAEERALRTAAAKRAAARARRRAAARAGHKAFARASDHAARSGAASRG